MSRKTVGWIPRLLVVAGRYTVDTAPQTGRQTTRKQPNLLGLVARHLLGSSLRRTNWLPTLPSREILCGRPLTRMWSWAFPDQATSGLLALLRRQHPVRRLASLVEVARLDDLRVQ